MKIWVAGANGVVGSAIIDLLKKKDIPHFGTTRLEVDLLNKNQINFYSLGVTHIINAAGYAKFELAEKNREEAFSGNVIIPENLARLAAQIGAHFIHLSTDYVFDGKSHRPYLEEDDPNPLNWYGTTKREGELRVLHFLPTACIVRISRVLGGPGKDYMYQVINLMQKHEELFFADDQIACPTYAPDLARALLRLLDQSGIYHFCNKGSVNKYELTRSIFEYARIKNNNIICKKIVPVSTKMLLGSAIRPLYTEFDTNKIEKLIYIRSWKECLEEFFL